MREKGKSVPTVLRAISTWAKKIGLKFSENKQLRGSGEVPLLHWLADRLVFSKVRTALGLDRAKFLFSGAAPLNLETMKYFGSLSLQVESI